MNRLITTTSDELKHKHKPVKEKMMKRDCAADSDDDDLPGGGEDEKRKRVASGKKGGGGGDPSMKSCQAEKCTADLSGAKAYHRRHKVCEHHAKAQMVVVAGIRQRFCQQCSRFHELSEFDDAKRSCRRRLAGHNERRRKNPGDSEGSSSGGSRMKGGGGGGGGGGSQLKELSCDDRGRIQMSHRVQDNSAYKHFHVR